MTNGTVRWWFDVRKGYGFIKPDDGGVDVLVDICAVERAGMAYLDQGQRLASNPCAMRGSADRAQAISTKAFVLFPSHIILPEINADGLAGASPSAPARTIGPTGLGRSTSEVEGCRRDRV